jgi:hypothetical protein
VSNIARGRFDLFYERAEGRESERGKAKTLTGV